MITLSPQNMGWIEVICGPMFGGKTEELIRRLRRAQYAKQKILIFKPRTDNRYGDDHIISHDQNKLESRRVKTSKEILKHAGEADVIGIDEAQFFDETIVPVSRKLANSGKRVIIAGLDKDYLGEPFGPIPLLLIEAEYITKTLSICVQCGNPANFSYRTSSDTRQIVVGEKDKYEARCRKCFEKESLVKKNLKFA